MKIFGEHQENTIRQLQDVQHREHKAGRRSDGSENW